MQSKNIFRFSNRLTILVVVAFASVPSLAAQVAIPGTSVSMDAPAGFTVSPDFSGLEHAESGSSILVVEMPAEAYADVTNLLSDPSAAKKGLAQQGVSLESTNTLKVDGQSVPFLTGSQSARGVKVGKYIAVLRGEVAVMITFNVFDPRILTQETAEKTIASVRLSPAPTLKQRADQLPFSFSVIAPFRLYAVVGGMSVGLATSEGEDPTGLKPHAVITSAVGAIPDGATPAQVAQVLARATKDFATAEIKSVKEVVFAGGPATYLEAVTTERKLIQYLRIHGDGVLTQLAVMGAKAEMDKLVDAVSGIAKSVSIRK